MTLIIQPALEEEDVPLLGTSKRKNSNHPHVLMKSRPPNSTEQSRTEPRHAPALIGTLMS